LVADDLCNSAAGRDGDLHFRVVGSMESVPWGDVLVPT
jgi:hypothetical protein